ncbi:hypothetical protein MED222_06260 [Vibrio sp. MED222]|nr:hypothetical protein MED222_06260 [Vibrio sp. MED222]
MPDLKSSSAFWRAPWLLSPLIDAALMPSSLSSLTRASVPCLVLVNTNTCCQFFEPIK